MSSKSRSRAAHPQRQAPDPTLAWVLSPGFDGEALRTIRVEAIRTGAGAPQIIDSFAFTGHACVQETMGRLEAAPPSRVVVMLPGTAVICRTLVLPSGSTDQLEMALRLQIENLLLGGSARWRTEGALLSTTDPDAPRRALVVEWPAKQGAPSGLEPIMGAAPTTFAPSIAALATLVTGAIGLGASESLAIDLDRAAGSIAIAFTDGIHSAFRVVREDGSDKLEWCAAVVRALHETLVLADLSDAQASAVCARVHAALAVRCDGFIAPLAGGLDSFRALVKGAPNNDDWWAHNGTAAGAVAALGQPTARLCELRAEEEAENPGIVRRAFGAAAKPRVAVRLAAAALLIIAFVPPALAGARLLYLGWLLPEPQAYARILDRDDEQGSMYRDYERYAWPITKLLGDVASTIPVGIELETITIGQGAPLTVTGNAKPVGANANAAEAILRMEEQMRGSGVFDRVEKSWDAPNANGIVKFDLTAAIVKPSLVPNYSDEQDFAKRTLRERKYGPLTADDGGASVEDGATTDAGEDSEPPSAGVAARDSEVSAAAAAAEPAAPAGGVATATPSAGGVGKAASTADEARARRRPSTTSGSGSGDIARRGRPGAEAAPPAVPEPLTDQQIAAMTQAEAREAAGRVSTARGLSGLDEATEARLKAEFYKLLDRARTP
jgi:hypothetical protein